MGAGNSSYHDGQEAYVLKHYDSVKEKLQRTKYGDGNNYTSTQIKSKLRQEYNTNGFAKYSTHEKDSYIPDSIWKSTGRRY
jgi:hypothetical protein